VVQTFYEAVAICKDLIRLFLWLFANMRLLMPPEKKAKKESDG